MFVHHLKLRPPQLQPAWIERRVGDRAGRHSGVVSLVAGPGYGKTVVAAQVFAAWRGPKLWYSLESADGDLAVFAAHFDALLRTVALAPELEGSAWQLGSIKEIASIFAGALTDLETPPLLVFDDVHVIENSRSSEVLSDLVGRLIRTGATVVLSGRSMPLGLHAFAAAGRLMRTGAADLAFDPAESRLYLERTASDGRTAVARDELVRLAEGWPAGLALVGSTGVADYDAAAGGATAGGDEARQLLFDYLAAEVLEALGERERRFLLETSILENLEVELCAAITGMADAGSLLRSFAARGLFVTRRSEGAYSAHRLFNEFLRAELTRAYATADVARLECAAADAYARRDDYVNAIRHRLSAGDFDAAVADLEPRAFALVASGLLSPVRAFFAQLGRERIDVSPTLLATLGRLQALRGDWDAALVSLERAIRLATDCADYTVLAEAVRAISPVLASRGEFARLDGLLARVLSLPIPEAARTALLSTQSAVYVETERYDDAVRLFAEIMPSIVARGDLALQGMVLHNTGAAHLRRGDPYAGSACYERALKVKRSAGQRVSALVTLANQIFVMILVGDLDEAERLVAQLREEATDLDNTTMLAYANENAGAIRLARGDAAAAATAYRTARGLCDPGDVLVLPEILHGYARALLAQGEPGAADDLCAKAIVAMRTVGRQQPIAPVVLTRAQCAFALADYDRGLALVEESLELAQAGDDALMRTSVNVEAAAALVRAAREDANASKRERFDQLARTATAAALALMERRDYRFLLRTMANAFATLEEPRRRWQAAERPQPSAAAESSVPMLGIELFGGLRVFVRGEPVGAKAWTRRKARDVFAHLVTLQGRLVPRARLVDLHWPDTDGDTAHDLLRVTISAIRKAVGNVVRYEEGGYRFVAPPGTAIDVDLFERHIEAARAAEASSQSDVARRELLGAVALYRGDFLEGAEDAWVWRERERLRKPYLAALRWLVRDRSGDPARTALLLDRLLEETPFDVEAVKLRLDAMTSELRTADAALEYDRWRSAYFENVGTEAPEIWRNPVRVGS